LGLAINLASGTDMAGKPFTASDAFGSLLPMSLNDLYSAMRSEGLSRGVALGLMSVMGESIQTYASTPKIAAPTIEKPRLVRPQVQTPTLTGDVANLIGRGVKWYTGSDDEDAKGLK
jgi:hypothetical protein